MLCSAQLDSLLLRAVSQLLYQFVLNHWTLVGEVCDPGYACVSCTCLLKGLCNETNADCTKRDAIPVSLILAQRVLRAHGQLAEWHCAWSSKLVSIRLFGMPSA